MLSLIMWVLVYHAKNELNFANRDCDACNDALLGHELKLNTFADCPARDLNAHTEIVFALNKVRDADHRIAKFKKEIQLLETKLAAMK
jgi:hypothetical protein